MNYLATVIDQTLVFHRKKFSLYFFWFKIVEMFDIDSIKTIENRVKDEFDFNRKRDNIRELHQSVPERLKKRLLKILPAEIFQGDEVFEEDDVKMKSIERNILEEIKQRYPKVDDIIQERSIEVDSLFELMQEDYEDVKLKSVDNGKLIGGRNRDVKLNWIAEYTKKLSRHREWNSKIYREPKNWQKKTLIDNGET